MLEIYNETIRDLLVVNKSGNVDGTRADIGTPVKHYTIKHDQSGNTVVSELTVVDVSNWREVLSLLHRASHSRCIIHYESFSFRVAMVIVLIYYCN